MPNLQVLCVMIVLLVQACTKDQVTESVVKSDELGSESPAPKKPSPDAGHATAAPKVTPIPAPVVPDSCMQLKMAGEPPFYLPATGIVVTRIMKACTTGAGRAGFDKQTPYLAMGVPCTGGGGRIDIKGHYGNPKMVSFVLSTDCLMTPSSPDAVRTLVSEHTGLPDTTKLLAFTPFVVQYWEIPGMSDADTGFSVDLRSAPAIEGAWNRIQKKEPLRVRLYGRENTWAPGGAFFEVEADLRLIARTQFQVTVQSMKSLSKDDIAAIKGRCEALRPARNCSEVF